MYPREYTSRARLRANICWFIPRGCRYTSASKRLTGPGVSMPSLQFLKKGRFFIDRLDPADKEQGSNLEDTFILVHQEGVLTRAPSEFLVELTTIRGALHSASFASSIRFARHVIMLTIGTRVFRPRSFSAQRYFGKWGGDLILFLKKPWMWKSHVRRA